MHNIHATHSKICVTNFQLSLNNSLGIKKNFNRRSLYTAMAEDVTVDSRLFEPPRFLLASDLQHFRF